MITCLIQILCGVCVYMRHNALMHCSEQVLYQRDCTEQGATSIVLKLILIDFSNHNDNRSRLLPGILQPYDKQTFSFTLRYRDLLLPGAGAGDCRHAAIGVGGTRATACAQHEDHGLDA